MTDIKFSFDYVLSIFSIIQSRTKAERSYNDHEGTKLVKQTAEIDALRVLYPLVKFKPDTTKKWFCKMYDLIDLFYGKMRAFQDDEELRDPAKAFTKELKMAYLVKLFRKGVEEEVPGGCKILLDRLLLSVTYLYFFFFCY